MTIQSANAIELYTYNTDVALFFKLKRIQRQAQVKTNHPSHPPPTPFIQVLSTKPLPNQHHQFLFAFVDLFQVVNKLRKLNVSVMRH